MKNQKNADELLTLDSEELLGEVLRLRQELVESKKNEIIYKTMVVNQHEGIVIVDLDENVTFCNPQAERIFGMPVGELKGRNLREFLPCNSVEFILEQTRKRLKGICSDYEIEIIRPDSTQRTLSMKVLPWNNDNGEVAGSFSSFRDITQFKEMENALRDSEARFRSVFDTAEDSIFIKDTSLRYCQVNRSMEKLFGMAAEDLVNKTDRDLFGDEAAVHIDEVDRRVLSGEVIEEEHAKPVNGEVVCFHVIKVPLRDESSRIKGICGIARNITHRKAAEIALADAQKRYYLASKAAKVGVWDSNLITKEFYIDPNLKAILGYSDEEIPNTLENWLQLVDDRDVTGIHDQIKAHLRGETPSFTNEFRMRHKDGSYRWIHCRGTAILDESSKPVRVIGTDMDITDWKIAAQERERLLKKLKDASEKIKILKGYLPICAHCKKIRDDSGYWHQVEAYIKAHSEAEFTHGLCPDCISELYPDLGE